MKLNMRMLKDRAVKLFNKQPEPIAPGVDYESDNMVLPKVAKVEVSKEWLEDQANLIDSSNHDTDSEVRSIRKKHRGFNAGFDGDKNTLTPLDMFYLNAICRSKGMSRRDRRILRRASKLAGSKVTVVVIDSNRKLEFYYYHDRLIHLNRSGLIV